MADTTAQRVRRAKAHKRDDHTYCRTEFCPDAGVDKRPAKASDAERARRYRRHKSGDHSMCLLGRCAAVTEDGNVTLPGYVTPETSLPVGVTPPEGLASRGSSLWRDVTTGASLGPLEATMLAEACRIADRLEQLDRQLRGEDWLRFHARDDAGTQIDVYVDKVLSEAREQATAFKGIWSELKKTLGQSKPAKGGGKLASVTALVPTLPAAR